jgi:short-subunit dehydrogenase
MARVFITGSADGLGGLAAKGLIALGHQVVLHARNEERARQAAEKVPGAEDVLIADLSDIGETKALAAKANTSGAFDAVFTTQVFIPIRASTARGCPFCL